MDGSVVFQFNLLELHRWFLESLLMSIIWIDLRVELDCRDGSWDLK